MWYKNVGTSFFRFVTIHAFVRQTDRQTDGEKGLGNYRALRYMQSHGKNDCISLLIFQPGNSPIIKSRLGY